MFYCILSHWNEVLRGVRASLGDAFGSRGFPQPLGFAGLWHVTRISGARSIASTQGRPHHPAGGLEGKVTFNIMVLYKICIYIYFFWQTLC